MLIGYTAHSDMINSPVRTFQGNVGLFNGSTLLNVYYHTDYLKSFTVERVGEGKFFGYGYCQKANIKLLDVNREKDITTDNSFLLNVGVDNVYVTSFPRFKVTEVHRDENTNELSITAYDKLYWATDYTVADLDLETIYADEGGYTLMDFATQAANICGISHVVVEGVNDGLFNTFYTFAQANFEGNESVRVALTKLAEVTHTIYYVNAEDALVFKRLDRDGAAVLEINRSKYIKLSSKTNRRLKRITKATTLGDNIYTEIAATGTNVIILDNPFYDLRDDVPEMLELAQDSVLGMCINQFECSWRGNYLLEIGDKIDLVCKDGSIATSYLLDDTFTYNGTVSQSTKWQYQEQNENVDGTPATIGEAIAQTFAKVDKVAKQIDLVVSEVEETSEQMAHLQLTQNQIQASVKSQDKEIDELTKRVEATMTSEEVTIKINQVLEQIEDIDTSEVTTQTGFTFNADGLTVEKSGKEMKTQITEDGMTVYRSGEAVLSADNEGVKAEDLHATTYLLIGTNSRFEDYNSGKRTGCFWIGEIE